MRTCLGLLFLLLVSLASGQAQKLRPYQRIQILCPSNPALNCERSISGNGTIRIPTLGTLLIGGLSHTEAQRLLSERWWVLKGIRQKFRVELATDSTESVVLFGPLEYTGKYPFREGLLLADALMDANPGSLADLTKIEVYDTANKRMVVDIEEDPYFTLKPADRIVVGRAKTASEVVIVGGVMNPGSIPYHKGMKLEDAIAVCGGFHPHGDLERLTLVRDGLGQAAAPAMKLQRGDVIRIPLVDKPLYITVHGAVNKPGSCPFKSGMTLTQLLPFVGGTSREANLDRVVIKPLKGKAMVVSLVRINSGSDADAIIPDQATITVESVR